MRLLPLCLVSVSKCADQKDRANRFAIDSVNLQFLPDGQFRVEATNTYVMIRVTGPCGSVEDYPSHASLEALPNGSDQALIPYKTWEAAFAMAKRTTKKRGTAANLKQLAVQLGTKIEKKDDAGRLDRIEQTVAFGATDTESFPIEQVNTIQKRWIRTDDVFACAKRNEVEGTLPNICPVQMSTLMNAIADILGEDEPRVEMAVKARHKPVVFTAKNSAGIEIEALIQPLAD